MQNWVNPPEADAGFTIAMDEVLVTYALPGDPAQPVVCNDEQTVQLIKETREPREDWACATRRLRVWPGRYGGGVSILRGV